MFAHIHGAKRVLSNTHGFLLRSYNNWLVHYSVLSDRSRIYAFPFSENHQGMQKPLKMPYVQHFLLRKVTRNATSNHVSVCRVVCVKWQRNATILLLTELKPHPLLWMHSPGRPRIMNICTKQLLNSATASIIFSENCPVRPSVFDCDLKKG